MPSLTIQPRAQLDIDEALTWYYPRNPALVPRLLADLDSIFDRLAVSLPTGRAELGLAVSLPTGRAELAASVAVYRG